jgi:hypothetical protein
LFVEPVKGDNSGNAIATLWLQAAFEPVGSGILTVVNPDTDNADVLELLSCQLPDLTGGKAVRWCLPMRIPLETRALLFRVVSDVVTGAKGRSLVCDNQRIRSLFLSPQTQLSAIPLHWMKDPNWLGLPRPDTKWRHPQYSIPENSENIGKETDMAFSESELRQIESTVGALCRRRSPAKRRDQLEFTYEIDRHNVSIYEVRPRWNNPKEKTKLGVARFKFIRKSDEWRLFWMRRDLKWHRYDPDIEATDLESLVRIVDNDGFGAFFG